MSLSNRKISMLAELFGGMGTITCQYERRVVQYCSTYKPAIEGYPGETALTKDLGSAAITSGFAFVLEVELQRELHDSRIAGGDDSSEAARLPGQSYPVEVGVVEDVEAFSSKLQAHGLTDLYVLEEGNIPTLQSRTANRAAP